MKIQITSSNSTKKWILAKITPVTVLAFFVFACYATLGWIYYDHFQCIDSCVDTNQSDWGQLGDFIGGLLNPVFAGLTLIVVSMTSLTQHKMIAEEREQLRLERENISLQKKCSQLEKAVENLDREFNRDCYVVNTRSYGKLKDALCGLYEFCRSYCRTNQNTFDFEKLLSWDVDSANHLEVIKNTSKILFVYSVLLESTLAGNKRFEILDDQRVSILGRAFDSTEHMAGYICYLLICERGSSALHSTSDFKQLISIISLLLDVADGGISTEFTDGLKDYIEIKLS